MAIAVASVATTRGGGGVNNVTVTKPTGLAAGDVLLAIISWDPSGGAPTFGWTEITSVSDVATYGIRAEYKVADAGDAAAANFTTTGGSANSEAVTAHISRITGAGVGSLVAASTSAVYATGSATVSLPGITPGTANCLLVQGWFSFSNFTASGYAVANNNPAWTERYDAGGGENLAVADAVYAPATATGDFSVTWSGSVTNAGAGLLVALRPVVNAAGTAVLYSRTPSFFSQAGGGGTSGTATLYSRTPSFFDPRTRSKDRIWTYEETPDTVWQDQELS